MNANKKGLIVGMSVLLVAFITYLGLWPVPPELPPKLVQSNVPNKTICPPHLQTTSGSSQMLIVQPGESIQTVVDQAHSGDTIAVMPGTYHEQVIVTMEQITLRGQSQGDRHPILDGENNLENGIIDCANQFTVEGFEIRNYRTNGVIAEDVDTVTMRDIITDHTGDYGLFPVRSRNVLVEHCVATGAADTGIYVGQSRDIVVQNNEAYANVSGFEIENSTNAVIQNNYSHRNTAGLLMFVLPDLTIKETRGNRITDNRLIGNNLANFADKEDIVSNIPAGTGILIVGTETNEIARNVVQDNQSVGIGLIDLRPFFANRTDFDIDTAPKGNWIHDNMVSHNGTVPSVEAKKTGLPGVDLLYDGSGWSNSWSETAPNRFPPVLPGRDWSDFMRRIYYRVINLLLHFV